MKNLSIKDLKRLGISEGEINRYREAGIWYLTLKVVGWRGHSIEFRAKTHKLYPQETPEAIRLLRKMEVEKGFDMNEVKQELEDKLKKMEEEKPKIRPKK